MTIKDKKTIHRMVNNNGKTDEGYQANTIWQYDSVHNGQRLYAVFMTPDHDMFSSPYVDNPVLLWSKREGKIQNPE